VGREGEGQAVVFVFMLVNKVVYPLEQTNVFTEKCITEKLYLDRHIFFHIIVAKLPFARSISPSISVS